MPVSSYDQYFGGNAAKARRQMISRYGYKKGLQVFHALVNKRKRS